MLDVWSDPGSPWRRALLEQHPRVAGFSTETVAGGLELALTDWNAKALERLVVSELGSLDALDTVSPARIATVVHGGAIPMPSLLDLVACLLLRIPVLSKPAASDPVTPHLVAESLRDVDPELGACLEVVDVHRDDAGAIAALLDVDLVVATGSDETMSSLRERLPARTALVEHGHKLSIAVLGADDVDLEEAARRLSVDVALWDQQGCLSPIACWVIGPPERSDAFAAALAAALAEREAAWPRGRLRVAETAAITRERSAAEMRTAAGDPVTLHTGPGTTWTVVREADATPRPAPLHRFVRIHPVADAAELEHAILPLAPHLAGVAIAALGPDAPRIEGALETFGATRLVPLGQLQAPPLDWARDGLGPLRALLAR